MRMDLVMGIRRSEEEVVGGSTLNRGKEDSGDYAQCLVKAS